MMPYIDKEKFRMHIIRYQRNSLKVILTDEEKEKFTRMLDEVPTADVVERKRGKWILGKDVPSFPTVPYFPTTLYCSECRNEAYWDTDYGQQKFDWCPYCGSYNGEE